MKILIIGLGCLLAVTGVYRGYVSVQNEKMKAHELQQVQAAMLALSREIAVLKRLPERPVVPLDAVYTAFINDMNMIARLHRLSWTITIQGRDDVDIEANARPSFFHGLREVSFHGAFSGITRQGQLLSLLDALGSLEQGAPVLFRNVIYKKDVLALDLAIIGP